MKRTEIKRRPLSDTTIANLEPEQGVYRVNDGGGLYLKVKPAGNKSWELRYKRADGKWSWLGLGRYPEVKGSAARKKAAKLRDDLADGKDPLAKPERQTVESLLIEWINSRSAQWSERYAGAALRMLQRYVFPLVGSKPFDAVTTQEWMTVFSAIERKGVLSQLRRVRNFCTCAYDLARVTGRIEHNPVSGLSRFVASPRMGNFAHVGADELPTLLRAIRTYPTHDVRIGLCLLAMLGCRPSELREAKWTEFDLDNGIWSIPAKRMKRGKAHTIPLPAQAVALLKELRVINGVYQWLFPGNDCTRPRDATMWHHALRRLGYAGRQTAHGFRHIASTLLNEQGFDENHIEAQLSHVKQGVAGVYNKARYLEQRRNMMQAWADYLDGLRLGA